jgi:Ulp1 family protease
MEVSQQLNGYDCGIYTCQWIKHLAFGRGIPDWSGIDCDDFRKMMCLELAEGQLRWTNGLKEGSGVQR